MQRLASKINFSSNLPWRRSSRSQIIFKIGVLKKFAIFIAWRPAWNFIEIRFQHIFLWILLRNYYGIKKNYYKINNIITKFLRTAFLQNASGGCFCKCGSYLRNWQYQRPNESNILLPPKALLSFLLKSRYTSWLSLKLLENNKNKISSTSLFFEVPMIFENLSHNN